MPRRNAAVKQRIVAAAAARANRHLTTLSNLSTNPVIIPLSPLSQPRENVIGETSPEECTWDGTVINLEPENESDFTDTDSDYSSDESDGESDNVMEGTEDLEGEELLSALAAEAASELDLLKEISGYEELRREISGQEWEKAETKRGFGYNGRSNRTKRRHHREEQEKNAIEMQSRKSNQAQNFRSFFKFVTPETSHCHPPFPAESSASKSFTQPEQNITSQVTAAIMQTFHHNPDMIFKGYASEIESDDDHDENWDFSGGGPEHIESSEFGLVASTRKRRKLDVSVQKSRELARRTKCDALSMALKDIQKVIESKRIEFKAGEHGLQAYRARAIQSHLHMVVHNNRKWVDASERAAESQNFAAHWGGRMVRMWTRKWVDERTLPESRRGCHAKAFSFLEDPSIRAELCSYLRSNKWSMNPTKLRDFVESSIITPEAQKHIQNAVNNEMPRGLIHYLETELFPRIQLKVVHSINLRTARKWLHKEGFQYIEHKKAIYYDGHERPDVVKYRQEVFLPRMAELEPYIVRYKIGSVEEELEQTPPNYVECRLVVSPQDECTTTSNDSQPKEWTFENDFRLKKKGPGRGLHQSDVITSVVGWLKEGSQTLEYGKNYEGYWNGELFVKQLKERIIPAFEKAHGAGYRALFMVDHSQGHAAYSTDALLPQRMNLNPGGKQARMRNGWFTHDGQIITQSMIFPPDHHEFSDMPKGMKHVLMERGLWRQGLRMECTDKACSAENRTSCCCKRILDLQPDFADQRSLVQETIEAAGHLCIFLPKFHCELNFIEFFWGAVKKYLRDNCDYTFETLKMNMPKALASVSVLTIRRWEHRMVRWMEAYRSGMDAKEAQFQVRAFSSKKYKSHRRVPESLAQQFDA